MRRKAWITMVLAIGMWTGPSRANEGTLDAAVEARFKEGLAFAREGKFEQARLAFSQALSLSPGYPKVLLNLALAEHDSGHYVEALGHLKQYFANPNANLERERELKKELYDELWRATGHLKISANPGEAISLNGEAKGNAPLADVVDVMPGSYRVMAGGRTIDVTVAAGETKDVNLASPPAKSPNVVELPKAVRENNWTGEHIAGVTLGGLAVVAAGVGVGFLAVRSGHVSDARSFAAEPNVCDPSTSSACSRLHNAQDAGKTAAVISGVSFGAAAALAVGATVLLWPKHKERARVVPTGQGLLVEGAF